MKKVAVFIDGAYLTKALKCKIDYEKLSKCLVGDMPYLRTYYYNAMPYKASMPSKEDSERYAKMQRFIDALRKIQRYTVRLGKVECRGVDRDGNRIFQQKRVDIQLGCDLTQLSAKQSISKAILVTGDSDFIPAIEMAKNEGVEVELVYVNDQGCIPHQGLLQTVDVHRPLTPTELECISIFNKSDTTFR